MKKIFYSLIVFLSLFIFTSKANALTCLYESAKNDGKDGKIYLEQYYESFFGNKNYKASARILGTATVTYKDEKVDIIDGFYAAKAYNNDDSNNGWKQIDECPKYLRYIYNGGDATFDSKDKAYTCDIWSQCDGSGGDKYVLTDLTADKTPDDVSLNDMICSYGRDNVTYSFKINFKKTGENTYSGSYKLLGNYTDLYSNTFQDLGFNTKPIEKCSSSGEVTTCTTYHDGFSIRMFWDDETNSYQCPPSIAVSKSSDIYAGSYKETHIYLGYKDVEVGNHGVEIGGFLFMQTHSYSVDEYKLVDSTSYIDYDTNATDEQHCVYTLESEKCNREDVDCQNSKLITLTERKYKDGRIEYFSSLNLTGSSSSKKITTSVDIDKLDCEDLSVLYTDCLNSSSNNCTVSDKEFTGSEMIVTDKYANTQDVTDAIEGMGNITGYNYRKMLCELSGRLEAYVPNSTLLNTKSLDIYVNSVYGSYNITKLDCVNWGFSDGYNCDTENCKNRILQITEQKIMEIREYCNNTFNKYVNNTTDQSFIERKEECMSFNKFYNDLVDKGIISDMSVGCDFITNDLGEKLIFVLDLLKIAGPIIAIGLGTLDFIKAIASGDSDKEMKTAFKRFSTRILAAILLFIIPIILAFLMDTFIGNQDGYDPENPFCNVVKWED